jgi:hypothetical protein
MFHVWASAGMQRLRVMATATAAAASCLASLRSFMQIASFFPSYFYGGGYVLQYLDYLTLYRILEANLRESP